MPHPDWNAAGGRPQSIFIGDNVPHKAHESADPWKSAYRQPSKVIKKVGDHQLIRTMSGCWYDSAPMHGWSLIGERMKPSEAIAKWEKRLRMLGVVE